MFHGVGSPHLSQKLMLGQHLTVVVEQNRKQAELYRREMDLLFTAHNTSRSEIDLHITESVRWVGRRGGTVATQRIRTTHPQVRVLLLSTYDGIDPAACGAEAFVSKDRFGPELLEALAGPGG